MDVLVFTKEHQFNQNSRDFWIILRLEFCLKIVLHAAFSYTYDLPNHFVCNKFDKKNA